jgi:hypothetical protein
VNFLSGNIKVCKKKWMTEAPANETQETYLTHETVRRVAEQPALKVQSPHPKSPFKNYTTAPYIGNIHSIL